MFEPVAIQPAHRRAPGGLMPRPSTEAEYLASLIPPSVRGTAFNRRTLFRGALGLGAAAGLAACGGGGGDSSSGGGGGGGGGKPSGTVTWGTNESGTTFAKQFQAEAADFTKTSGVKVTINAVEHNTFQENINNYLQGSPDDVFTWFAGDRMKFFAKRGLIGDVSDVWPLQGIPDSFKQASTGEDGKQYFVPQSYYPWAVFYRKSLWQQRGYEPPKTLDEFTALARKMKADGVIPIAFADKDGWPAMGTFDILNLRTNGYDFHISLMAGKESWTDPRVKQVFDTWRGLLEHHQPGANGRTWQEAAQSLAAKQTGMYVLGSFVNEQF